jgi:hypothetical protein
MPPEHRSIALNTDFVLTARWIVIDVELFKLPGCRESASVSLEQSHAIGAVASCSRSRYGDPLSCLRLLECALNRAARTKCSPLPRARAQIFVAAAPDEDTAEQPSLRRTRSWHRFTPKCCPLRAACSTCKQTAEKCTIGALDRSVESLEHGILRLKVDAATCRRGLSHR